MRTALVLFSFFLVSSVGFADDTANQVQRSIIQAVTAQVNALAETLKTVATKDDVKASEARVHEGLKSLQDSITKQLDVLRTLATSRELQAFYAKLQKEFQVVLEKLDTVASKDDVKKILVSLMALQAELTKVIQDNGKLVVKEIVDAISTENKRLAVRLAQMEANLKATMEKHTADLSKQISELKKK